MKKNKQKKKLKGKRTEKICLISLVVIVFVFLIAVYYFSIRGYNFSQGWFAFVVAFFVYNALTITPVILSGQIKEYSPIWIPVLILLLLINIPLIVLFFLLLSGRLTLPDYPYIYGYGFAILIPASFITGVCYDLIIDKLKERKKETKNK